MITAKASRRPDTSVAPLRIRANSKAAAIIASAAVAALSSIASGQVTGTWKAPVNGSWGDSTRWVGAVIPGAAGDTANFSTLNLTSDVSVSLDGDRTVGNLLFGDTTPSNNWIVNPGAGGTLVLLNNGSAPTIVVNSGVTATINANLSQTATPDQGLPGVNLSGGGTLVVPQLLVSQDILESGPGLNSIDIGDNTTLRVSTLTLEPSNNTDSTPFITGNGTLQLNNTASSFSNPSLIYGTIPNSNNDNGLVISSKVDLGSGGSRWITGNGNNNQFSVHNGDVTISGNISGSAGMTVDVAGYTGNPFSLVLSGDNSAWTGPLNLVSGSVVPYDSTGSDQQKAISAKNAVVFSPGAGQTATLYLYGQTVSIGSLSSSGAGTSQILNAQWTTQSNGNHFNYLNTGNLTVNQSSDGIYGGLLADGPSDRGPDGATYFPLALTKAGAATLTLTGNNSYSGGTTINGGTLEIAGAAGSNPVGTGNVAVNTGGTLKLTQSNIFSNGVSVPTQSITLTGGTLTNNGSFNALGNVTMQGGTIAATPGLTSGQFEAFSLNGSVTSLASSASSLLSSTGAGAGYHLSGNTNFTVASGSAPGGQDLVISGNLLDQDFDQTPGNRAGGLTKSGPGTLVLSGTNSFTGPVAVNGGTLVVNGSNATTAQLSVSSGAVKLGAAGAIHNNSISFASGTTFDVSAQSGGFALGSGQTLIAGHSGAGANDVIGSLAFGAGSKLNVGGTAIPATLGISGNLSLTNASAQFDLTTPGTAGGATNDLVSVGGNLTLAGTNGISAAPGSGSLANGTYTLFAYGGALTGGPANLSLAGNLQGTTRQAFSFTNDAAARTVSLSVSGSAANLVWTGDGATNNWDLKTTSDWTNGAATDKFFNLDSVSFTDAGSSSPAVNIVGSVLPSGISVNSAKDYTFSGAGSIGGSPSLVKSGSGTLTISNTNSFTGPVTVNGGTVAAASIANSGSPSALGAGGSLNIGAGTLRLTGSSATSDRSVSITDTASTVEVTSAGSTIGITGVVNGSGTLNKTGAGTLALSGVNTYTGPTDVSAGTLALAGDSSLGAAPAAPQAAAVSLKGGNLQFNGPATLSPNRGITVSASATFDTQANTVGIAGPIVGTALTLTKIGAGTLSLTGANTFAANLAISGGTLQVPSDAGLGAVPASTIPNSITLSNNASLAFTADTSISPSRGITIGTGGGQINSGGTNTTVSGSIAGPAGNPLSLTGGGTFTLTSPSSYAGGTLVSTNKLTVLDPVALGTGPVTFLKDGFWQINIADGVIANNLTLSPTDSFSKWQTDAMTHPNLAGVISGGNASLQIETNLTNSSSDGGITLSNPNNTFTASIIDINRGRLAIAANGALGNPTNEVFIDVTRSGSGDAGTGFHFLAPNISVPNPFQLNDYSNFNVNGNNGEAVTGNISGPGGSRSAPYYVLGGVQDATMTSIGSLKFAGTNSFTQNINVGPDTTFIAGSPTAFGTKNTITDTGGATIGFDGAGVMTNSPTESIVLNGGGALTNGAPRGSMLNVNGNNTFNGNVLLATDSNVGVAHAADTLTIGTLDTTQAANGGTGTAALTKIGPGTLAVLNHLIASGPQDPVSMLFPTASAPGASFGTLTVTAGDLSVSGPAGQTGALNISGGTGVTISTGARLSLASTGPRFTNVISEPLTVNGILDVGNQAISYVYGSNPSPDAAIKALVDSGRAGTTGIISTTALANKKLGVGYKDIPATHTELIETTLLGDANLDSKVNFSDFNLLASNFGKIGTEWSTGDFNSDGKTNFSDFNLLAANFGQQLTAPQTAQVLAFGQSLAIDPSEQAAVDAFAAKFSSVPEPSSAALLGFAAMGLLARRRRTRV